MSQTYVRKIQNKKLVFPPRQGRLPSLQTPGRHRPKKRNAGKVIHPGKREKEIEKLQIQVAKKLGYKLADHKLELYGSKIKK